MDVRQAIEAPRLRHNGRPEIVYESRLPQDMLKPLVAAGYRLEDAGPWSRLVGGINAIDCPNGLVRVGGADPWRACYAVAA